VYKEYEGQFNLLSIAKDERPGHGESPLGPREMVAKEGWPWDFGYGEHIVEAYGVTKIPVTIFIDASGAISFTQTGYMDKDAFKAQLEQILP